jgi:hypothetical protein
LKQRKKIEFDPYAKWRLYMNVERACREFRNEAPDAPWNSPATFDAIYKLAKAKEIDVEF